MYLQNQEEIVKGTGAWYREQNRIRAKKFRDRLQNQGYKQTGIYIREKYLDRISGSRHIFFDKVLQDHFQHHDKQKLVKEIKKFRRAGLTSIEISEKVQKTASQVRKLW